MNDAPIIAALAFSLLSGAIWLVVYAGERRRRSLRERLAGISVVSPAYGTAAKESAAAHRARRGSKRIFLLSKRQQERLDEAFDACGRRINLWHLAAVAAFAMALVVYFVGHLLQFHYVLALLIGCIAAAGAPVLLLRFMQSRYQNQFLEDFPDALDLVARAVKAGLPPLDAVDVAAQEIVPPVGSELQRILDEVRIGIEVNEAFEHATKRIRLADFRFFVATLTLQRRTGGALAETLNNLSGVIRARKAIRRKARALTAEAKTSAVAVGLSPFIAGAAVYYHSHSLMMILFLDPRGRFMLGVAILFLLAGFVTMYWMIKRALR